MTIPPLSDWPAIWARFPEARASLEAEHAAATLPKPEIVDESASLRREVDALRARVRHLEKKAKEFGSIAELLTAEDENGEMGIVSIAKMACGETLIERAVLRDCGTYDADRLYGRGATITHSGGMWTAQMEVKGARPGEGNAWRLMHKTEVGELRRMVREEVSRLTKGQR